MAIGIEERQQHKSQPSPLCVELAKRLVLDSGYEPDELLAMPPGQLLSLAAAVMQEAIRTQSWRQAVQR